MKVRRVRSQERVKGRCMCHGCPSIRARAELFMCHSVRSDTHLILRTSLQCEVNTNQSLKRSDSYSTQICVPNLSLFTTQSTPCEDSSEIRMSVFLHQVWRNVSAMDVNGCRQNDKNITALQSISYHQKLKLIQH